MENKIAREHHWSAMDSDHAEPQLRRALGLADTALMIVAALVSLNTMAPLAQNGPMLLLSPEPQPRGRHRPLGSPTLQPLMVIFPRHLLACIPVMHPRSFPCGSAGHCVLFRSA